MISDFYHQLVGADEILVLDFDGVFMVFIVHEILHSQVCLKELAQSK